MITSQTVAQISAFVLFFCFFTFKMAEKLTGKHFFDFPDDSRYTLGLNISSKSPLSSIVLEITAFFCFMQSFKMAVKTGTKNDFWKKLPDDYAYTLLANNFVEIALSQTFFWTNTF